eukprot:CAMPEP_0174933268 /NCGR_PEP_ID=MMETSP1355-20121228/44529_1 /TAXON_ID=464990 /ORGANISM="Hemiselmis tepida, Strain CCMP443" /LENGTH=56 /DNA_ID=CAMNT_0016179753 /DNA_START=6 /DNA_END=172 /DNA_ORIENTATION=+
MGVKTKTFASVIPILALSSASLSAVCSRFISAAHAYWSAASRMLSSAKNVSVLPSA